MLYPVELQTQRCKTPSSKFQIPKSIRKFGAWSLGLGACESRVVDGTRTRNNQNHNLGLYH